MVRLKCLVEERGGGVGSSSQLISTHRRRCCTTDAESQKERNASCKMIENSVACRLLSRVQYDGLSSLSLELQWFRNVEDMKEVGDTRVA